MIFASFLLLMYLTLNFVNVNDVVKKKKVFPHFCHSLPKSVTVCDPYVINQLKFTPGYVLAIHRSET